MKLSPFEHHFIRVHKKHFTNSRAFLLAISGGVDSMVLLHLFHKFQKQMQSQFRVLCVHHGLSPDKKINEYRTESLNCVQDFCKTYDVKFLTNFDPDSIFEPATGLNSEQQLRDFRYGHFNAFKQDHEILVLAHHLDDLLETQMLDLIRGSHFEHWSQHKEHSGQIFRPLAHVSKEDILQYAKEAKLQWCEDPTNQQSDSLRNWLRNGFLKELSEKSKGLKANLMKNLVKLYEHTPILAPVAELEITANSWLTLTQSDKQQFVLRSARRLGLKSMTQGQILDILQKLDLGQKEIKFQTGPIFWIKTTDKIQAYRETS